MIYIRDNQWSFVDLWLGVSVREGMSGATLDITDKMEAQSPAPSPHSAGTYPGMKDLGLVILTCLFLSLAELTKKEY